MKPMSEQQIRDVVRKLRDAQKIVDRAFDSVYGAAVPDAANGPYHHVLLEMSKASEQLENAIDGVAGLAPAVAA